MLVISCQRCQKTVKSHDSLLDINSSTYDLLSSIRATEYMNKSYKELLSSQPRHLFEKEGTGRKLPSFKIESIQEDQEPIPNNVEKEKKDVNNVNNKKDIEKSMMHPNFNLKESFVMLNQSQLSQSIFMPYIKEEDKDMSGSIWNPSPAVNYNFSHSLSIQSKLFDTLNELSDFDHPLCEDCFDIFINGLTRKLNDVEREKKKYREFNPAQLFPNNLLKKNNMELEKELENEIEKLKEEEASSILSLKHMEKQLEDLKLNIKELEEERYFLNQREERYWKDVNAYQLQLSQFEIECSSINAKYKHDLRQLEILHNTSVYNDVFYITNNYNIGTINGLKLGVLPDDKPDWIEINAAWGQTVLALHIVAKKLKYEFTRYLPLPNGSFSKIEKIDNKGNNKEYYELFLASDSTLSRLLLINRYNKAMEAYLYCLEELNQYIQTLDPSFHLPYKIADNKINNLSIHYQGSNHTQWSRALRYTLKNTKTLFTSFKDSAK